MKEIIMSITKKLAFSGVVTRGLYAKLVTTNVTGTPTFIMNTTQEVTGNLTQ
jgi:protein-disulfide isomerase